MYHRNKYKVWEIKEEEFAIKSTLPLWLKSLILGRPMDSIFQPICAEVKVAPRAKMKIKKKEKDK